MTDEDCEKLFKACDADGSGKVDASEYLLVSVINTLILSSKRVIDLFKVATFIDAHLTRIAYADMHELMLPKRHLPGPKTVRPTKTSDPARNHDPNANLPGLGRRSE